MNTSKSLANIIDDYFGNAHPNTKANAAEAIVEAVEGLINEAFADIDDIDEVSPERAALHKVEAGLLQAIKEWQEQGGLVEDSDEK